MVSFSPVFRRSRAAKTIPGSVSDPSIDVQFFIRFHQHCSQLGIIILVVVWIGIRRWSRHRLRIWHSAETLAICPVTVGVLFALIYGVRYRSWRRLRIWIRYRSRWALTLTISPEASRLVLTFSYGVGSHFHFTLAIFPHPREPSLLALFLGVGWNRFWWDRFGHRKSVHSVHIYNDLIAVAVTGTEYIDMSSRSIRIVP